MVLGHAAGRKSTMIKTLWYALVLVTMVAIGGSASAQSPARPAPLMVIELFTSQGCSSCPAADAVFKSYAARRDLVALSMSVDYWDYLGWKDTLASPKFSKRQRAYAQSRGDGQVYTPQAVIDGRDHVVGSSKGDIEAALKAHAAKPSALVLAAGLEKGTITINIGQAVDVVSEMTVWLAVVQNEANIDVKAGENRGRKLTYFNVVRDMVPAGMWSGAATTIRQSASALSSGSNQRFAVLVQRGTGGPIVAATWVDASTN